MLDPYPLITPWPPHQVNTHQRLHVSPLAFIGAHTQKNTCDPTHNSFKYHRCVTEVWLCHSAGLPSVLPENPLTTANWVQVHHVRWSGPPWRPPPPPPPPLRTSGLKPPSAHPLPWRENPFSNLHLQCRPPTLVSNVH